MDLKGKNVLLTGAANGIGVSYVKELAKAGVAKIAILDVSVQNGENLAKEVNAEHGAGKAVFHKCDVCNKADYEALIKKVHSEFGGLDIVINNAGIMNDSLWEKEIAVNLNGVVIGTMTAISLMSKEHGGKGGVIVNIASILGLAPLAGCPVYVATKHAVIGLTRSYALPYHYNKSGIRMMVMCPGVTDTDLISGAGKRQITEDVSAECHRELSSLPAQPTANVADGMLKMLKSGANGSVWVSEGNQPTYEIQIPERGNMRK